jgi:hypothetical protein
MYRIPLGLSDFKELRENDYYYVDKSLFIAEMLNRSDKVLLLPRPRRFGKTLNLSMLRYFFEKQQDSLASLFKGLAIEANQEAMSHQGQYPVIFLSFKDCKASSIEKCLSQIRGLIIELYEEYQPLLYQEATQKERENYDKIIKEEQHLRNWEMALKFLMRLIHQKTGQRVIVLLDEYDTPIHAGQEHGYYDEIILFMRNLLSGALKDNTDLEKGVVTGILRIAKESIFSGLNNLGVFSLLEFEFQDCFGFTETEIKQLTQDFSLNSTDVSNLTLWYNGYLFGNVVIYNPWSVLTFISRRQRVPRPYWINTSSNALLRELITRTDPSFQSQIQKLLANESIQSPLNENIVLRDLKNNETNIWSLLVFSGYLKSLSLAYQEGELIYELTIPNLEIRSFYRHTIQDWLQQTIGSQRLRELLQALIQTDWEAFGELLQELVLAVLSHHDTAGQEPERVYHAFVLGLLTNLNDRYSIRSNLEAGYGRYDVLMSPKNLDNPGFVFEFKKFNPKKEKTVQETIQNALQQISDRQYATELREEQVKEIWGIGIAIQGKQVALSCSLL